MIFNWQSQSTLPYNFQNGSAVVYDGKIHILGSYNSESRTNHYSWNGTQWTEESTLPYDFYNGSAVVYDNKIHILGGSGNRTNHYSWNGTQWAEESTLPYDFYSGSAVVYDNKIHILGFTNHYSWNGTQWTEESTLPYDFYLGSAIVYDNKIHILGGFEAFTNHYSWNGTQWTEESTLPYDFDRSSAIVYDNKIHILGSYEYSTKYYSWNGTQWTEESTLPYYFYNGSAVVYDNKIHILGSTEYPTNHYAAAESPKSTNKVVYGDETLIDLTADTVTSADVLSGVTFHDASGDIKTGSCSYDADTSDADATAADIISGKTAYVNGSKLTGSLVISAPTITYAGRITKSNPYSFTASLSHSYLVIISVNYTTNFNPNSQVIYKVENGGSTITKMQGDTSIAVSVTRSGTRTINVSSTANASMSVTVIQL